MARVREVEGERAHPQLNATCGKSKFVCQMSGTLFPLGPKTDGEAILLNLGGDWVGTKSEYLPFRNFSRWKRDQGPRLCEMFERVSGGRLRRRWSTLHFRKFIGEFCLRRTRKSELRGKLIIGRQLHFPKVLTIAPPPGCPDEASAGKTWADEDLLTSAGGVDMRKLEGHVGNVRQRAWSSFFDDYVDLKKNVKEAERKLKDHFHNNEQSFRVATLAKLIREINHKGEKFIIACDRLFLLRLAHLVYITLFSN